MWDLFKMRQGLFARSEIIQLVCQAITGVKDLHSIGVVHGDLSFTNMLCRRRGPSQWELRLCDLGSSFTRTEHVVPRARPACTTHVRAVELFFRLAASGITEKVDVWAMGVLLGSLMCSTLLFRDMEQIVAALGPVTELEWPGCSELSGYRDLGMPQLCSRYLEACLVTFFTQVVERKVSKEDPALTLLGSMLRWLSKDRCSAQVALEHSFFCNPAGSQGMHADSESIAVLLNSCNQQVLVELIQRHLRTGAAMTVEAIQALSGQAQPQLPIADARGSSSGGDQSSGAQPGCSEERGLKESDNETRTDRQINRDGRSVGVCKGNCGRQSCRRNQHTKQRPKGIICADCDEFGERCGKCRCEHLHCPIPNGGARLKRYGGRRAWEHA